MAQTCSKCSRVNPVEAVYCYFDGAALNGHAGSGGSLIITGTQPFPQQFVFPSGRACGNFDQLAIACQENWAEALDILQQGYLEMFLANLGRADLAQAARQAKSYPDRDRGLDQLLAQLPSDALPQPTLRVEPTEINLGQMRIGEERKVEVVLRNTGARLLYGAVLCDNSPWLSLGESSGSPRKLFQFATEQTITLHIRGQGLRASTKPLEGMLVVESNGGMESVLVRVVVPVKTFPNGVLAGATTPRQIAEKAKSNPKEAVRLFESGAVEKWYQDNGWTYPVPGPSASGLAAIQQFFEALGLTRPPKVEVSHQALQFVGNPGQRLEQIVQVRTPEKRPVYASARCNKDWIQVGQTQISGRKASIPLAIAAVPDRPGEILNAKVVITANGNQQFHLPVSLQISGQAAINPFAALEIEEVPAVSPVTAAADIAPRDYRAAPPVAPLVAPAPLAPAPAPEAVTPRLVHTPFWVHLLAPVLLAFTLFVVFLRDWLVDPTAAPPFDPSQSTLRADTEPPIAIRFHERIERNDFRDQFFHQPTMRFGLVMLRERDPRQSSNYKQLTFDDKGRSNNTCLRIDGQDILFGTNPPGRWLVQKEAVATGPFADLVGAHAVWSADASNTIVVTQTVQLVPGEQSGLLDTALVRYQIENRDEKPRRVGLRFMLDTYIGANDGVPFMLPGAKGLNNTSADFNQPAAIPDFIQALEREDLKDPGTIAHLQLKLGGRFEAPSRVTLGAWPNERIDGRKRCLAANTLWEVPVHNMDILHQIDRKANKQQVAEIDSAVVIYWNERPLPPGETRLMGFTYGLGSVSADDGGKLALTVGGSFVPGGEFTLTAYVHEPVAKQTVTLNVPEGFRLISGSATQAVPALAQNAASRNSPVTWRIQAPKQSGTFELRVDSSTNVSRVQTVRIRDRGIFD
ncbi:MAG: hypothetical protein ACK4RK_11755 [Gemmataceae bacterium]